MERLHKALLVRQPDGDEATRWVNSDVVPLPPARRTWTNVTYLSWWSIFMLGSSNFQLGASLVASGLSVWQAVIAVIIGRCITAGVAILNGHPGAVWHIGFPVFARSVWGIWGSYLPVALRILLSLVGLAVQSWLGGLCITVMLSAMSSSFANMPNTIPISSAVTTSQLTGWIVFLAAAVPFIWIRPENSRSLMVACNACALTTLIAITIWSLATAHGGGPLLSAPSTAKSSADVGWGMLGGINSVIGTVAPAMMSQPDFSRFARRPNDQIFGQAFAFIFVGTLVPVLGCLTASATLQIYGTATWNPPLLLATWLRVSYSSGTRAAAFFAALGLGIGQLAITVVDNAYGLGIDLSSVFPRYITIRRGGYMGLLLAMALVPWELLSSASVFLTIVSSFTLIFGPICGVQIVDHWIVRKRKLALSDLFHARADGRYYFTAGFNWRAFVAFFSGFAPFLPGMIKAVNPTVVLMTDIALIFNLAFWLGGCIAGVVYYGLVLLAPIRDAGEFDSVDYYGTFTHAEAEKLGIQSSSASQADEQLSDEQGSTDKAMIY